MKPITEMSYEELTHMTIREIRELEDWERFAFVRRISKFENEEMENKTVKIVNMKQATLYVKNGLPPIVSAKC